MDTNETPKLDIIRRTFEAAKHPPGSEERAQLNRDARTSEYMPSYRYLTSDGRSWRTKKEAALAVELAERYPAETAESAKRRPVSP
jgi:hypothetical protein